MTEELESLYHRGFPETERGYGLDHELALVQREFEEQVENQENLRGIANDLEEEVENYRERMDRILEGFEENFGAPPEVSADIKLLVEQAGNFDMAMSVLRGYKKADKAGYEFEEDGNFSAPNRQKINEGLILMEEEQDVHLGELRQDKNSRIAEQMNAEEV